MHVVIYVQHLLGSGHLVRMRLLADALVASGQRVSLISGGPFSGPAEFDVLQLPPVHTAPGDFNTLLDADGAVVDMGWKSSRARLLVDHVQRLRPDVLVIETWPFGRRQMEFEILPMVSSLSDMPSPPGVVCSIRDVLQARSEKRRRETLGRIRQYLSLVMVHGDPAIVDLSASFPEHGEIACPLVYTGYIGAPDVAAGGPLGQGEIIVSAGGGAAGMHLLEVAVAAANSDTDSTWRILVGPRIPDQEFQRWRSAAGVRVVVERNRADFRKLLEGCAASVSQLGYNTAVDLLMVRCPAVVVPYAGDGETEQQTRAEILAGKGFVTVLPDSDLDVGSLLSAVASVRRRAPPPAAGQVALNGAEAAAELIGNIFRREA